MKSRSYRSILDGWHRDLSSSSWWAWLAGVLVLPQLPFWLAGLGMPLQRPVFNVDLILGAVLLCWSQRLGVLVLMLLVGLDVLRSASLVYHFPTPAEMFSALRFAGLVEAGQVLSWPMIAGLTGLAASIGLLMLLTGKMRGSPFLLVALAPLLWGVDLLNGSSQLFGLGVDRAKLQINVVGSAGWNVYSSWRVVQALKTRPMQALSDPKAYRAASQWMQEQPDQSTLVVIVESFGRPREPALNDWLRKQLLSEPVLARWTVQEEAESFLGSTTRGELRTLCAVNGHYSRLTPEVAGDCLPQRARSRGDQVHGLHGFSMNMFDRTDWWPRIGLTPWSFGPGLPRGCNAAFPGVCDAAVLQQGLALVDAPQRFVYVLTLDTHLPLPAHGASAPDELLRSCEINQVPTAACDLVANLGSLLARIGSGLATLRRPPLVIVVGDHAPPFISAASRDAFEPDRVPLFVLRPRQSPVSDATK